MFCRKNFFSIGFGLITLGKLGQHGRSGQQSTEGMKCGEERQWRQYDNKREGEVFKRTLKCEIYSNGLEQ